MNSPAGNGIVSHQYPNGLVLVAEPMPWLQSAAFTFLVPAGSVFDPDDRSGLATFTAEMLMRGAGSRNSRKLVNDLDRLGVEHGEGVTDAHVSLSGATLADNLIQALAIYSDILRRPHLPDDQIPAARMVLEQELQTIEDEPQQKVMLELRRRHYPYPWGRPSVGEASAIRAVTVGDVRQHYTRLYRPGSAILGVAGKFDFARLRDMVGVMFGDWVPLAEPRVQMRNNRVPHDHIPHESTQTQIGVAWNVCPYRDPDYFRAWGAVAALSGGMSSRLFTEVREKRGLCYSVFAMHHTFKDIAAVLCYAGTTNARAQETLDVLLGELVRLREGVEESEIARIKARAKSALVMAQESSTARSSALARDWYYLGYPRSLNDLAAEVEKLSKASIDAYLTEHPPEDFTILTLGPERLRAPGEPEPVPAETPAPAPAETVTVVATPSAETAAPSAEPAAAAASEAPPTVVSAPPAEGPPTSETAAEAT